MTGRVGRPRKAVEHPSPVVQRLLRIAEADGRAFADIAMGAGVSESWFSHARNRSYHVSMPVAEQIAYELGYQLEFVRRDPKAPRPPFQKSRR